MRIAIKLYLSLFILIAGSAAASAQVVGGTISGTVHEATGASLDGAAVTVRQIETGATRNLTTGADGRFYAPSIPVGAYTVSVSHDGFATRRCAAASLSPWVRACNSTSCSA